MEIKINHIINSILYPISILIIIYYIFHWINNSNKLKNVLQEEYQQMINKNNNPYINQNIYNKLNKKNNLNSIESENNNNNDNNDSFVDVFCKDPKDMNKKINEYIDEYSGKVKELTHELGTVNNPLVNRLNTEKCDKYFKDRYNLKNLGHYNEDDITLIEWDLSYTMRSTGSYRQDQKQRKELMITNYSNDNKA